MGNPYPVQITDNEGEARLTGYADFTDSGNQPGGGSQPGAAIWRGPFAFDYTMATDLAAGIAFYVPTVDELLLEVCVFVLTAFDGDTPGGDVGTFSGGTEGLFATVINNGPINLGYAPSEISNNAGLLRSRNDFTPLSAAADDGWSRIKITGTNPLMLVASQDGTLGGTPIDSAAGAGEIYIATSVPVAFA